MPDRLPSRPEDRRCPDDESSGAVLSIDRTVGELVLGGEFDMASAPRLQELIAEAADGHALVIDLADLTFVDSTGLLCLVHAWQKTGRPVVLRRTQPNVLRVLELSGHKIGSTAWVIEATD